MNAKRGGYGDIKAAREISSMRSAREREKGETRTAKGKGEEKEEAEEAEEAMGTTVAQNCKGKPRND